MKIRFLELTTKTLNVRIDKNNDVNLRFVPRTLTNKDAGVQNGDNTFFCRSMSDAVVYDNPSAFMHYPRFGLTLSVHYSRVLPSP